ncbi:MAG: hypothetical protein IR164_04600 [Devosia sp.]|jgi:hypothetical protein|uniref:hypothetical protein n=1 Tax=Devosia sp. TaxID=1871048 RepID=UPI0019DE6211|nr:hypothetical protein [Devosia sp.]MBF0678203.1 hypothetical protein [Devosia sp.]
MRLPLILAAALLAGPASASEDIAAVLDRIAPLLQAEEFEKLGGPNTPAEIARMIEGRWFTLDNTARNWSGDAEADRRRLAQTIARTCADDWEVRVTMETTGTESFRVVQVSPDGADQGTTEMMATPGTERHFTSEFDEDYIVALFELDENPRERGAVLAEMRERLEGGLDLWLPSPDVSVNVSPFETEVWGRCPE